MKLIVVTKQELVEHINLMREHILMNNDTDSEIIQTTDEILERLEIDIENESD